MDVTWSSNGMDLTAAEVESNAYEWSWWIIEVSCKTRKGSFLTSTGHRLELIAGLVGGGLKEVGAGGRKSCCCSSAAMRGSTLKKNHMFIVQALFFNTTWEGGRGQVLRDVEFFS